MGGAWNRSEMHTKLQLLILKVTDHYIRSEIIEINITEVGRESEVASSGSGSRRVTSAFEHRNKLWVPGKASFLNTPTRRSYCPVPVTRGFEGT